VGNQKVEAFAHGRENPYQEILSGERGESVAETKRAHGRRKTRLATGDQLPETEPDRKMRPGSQIKKTGQAHGPSTHAA
jgi:hypothetical protein